MKKALGLAVGSKDEASNWLEFFFGDIFLNVSDELTSKLDSLFGSEKTISGQQNKQKIFNLKSLLIEAGLGFKDQFFDSFVHEQKHLSNNQKFLAAVWVDLDDKPSSTAEVYLKLHLISRRNFKPNQLNLKGLFQFLPMVAWTNQGPFSIADLPKAIWQSRLFGKHMWVRSLDKFPPLTDYVIPDNVRIADTARVRLGAYLGSGTTVMHEGFVNFNAGTQGPNMVEGRISAGVWVAKNSDIGGGASTMGTLSGGGEVLVSVGENCLIGANAGLGIPLGDNCTIEAGLYLTANSKITVLEANTKKPYKIVKAHQLSNASNLLFRRNSLKGNIECIVNSKISALNDQLHANS